MSKAQLRYVVQVSDTTMLNMAEKVGNIKKSINFIFVQNT
jgi:two-component SAPR family response regulator